jgi:hypothetical protein
MGAGCEGQQQDQKPAGASRAALLSQEGSAGPKGPARAEVPKANAIKMRLWNLPSRDPDYAASRFVSITLPS